MKNILKFSLLLLGVSVLFTFCKKEELDLDALTDFPPGILSVYPSDNGKVDQGDFDINVKFISGSVSTLASGSVKLLDANGAELKSVTKSLSTTRDSIVIAAADFNAATLPLGNYKLVISVTDTKGKTQDRITNFEIYNLPAIGLIGSATPDGWNSDQNMTHIGGGVFEMVITLVAGEVKFRADDSWTVNWGSGDFPSGVGTQDGPNIPVPAGTWKVTFNAGTGAYSFTPAISYKSKISGLYLLGTFNNFQGEDRKFNLVADNTWELTETLMKKSQLFRFAEGPNFMGTNWGDNEPDGRADEFGSNITFNELDAYYKVTFNDKTLQYSFTFIKFPTIGIIGSATPGGWGSETQMTDKGNGTFELTLDLVVGEAKFRANNSWDVNWGGSDFPSGTGVQNGPNIPINTAGSYKVTFAPATGAYNFELQTGPTAVGLIGSATPGGWGGDTDLGDNGDGTWSAVVGLDNGEVKFRANHDWAVNWGGSGFPTGTGTQNGPNIAVTKGIYLVTFKPATGEYSFAPASIGIIGSATPDGWNSDQNMTEDAAVGVVKLNITLVAGEAKFRANDDWKFNWGGSGFPTGTGTRNGPNIPVPAGTYNISFNVNTGEYSFN